MVIALAVAAVPVTAQSVMERTPNMAGGWTGPPATLHFNFLHRFNQSGPPARQVVNRPTFLLAGSPVDALLAGVHYATRSDLVPGLPNEWEFFARGAPLRGPLEVAVQAGYNHTAESFDAEVGAAHRFGPVRALLAGRAFSAYAGDSARFAVAGGLIVRLRPWLALAADAATLLEREDNEEVAWGAAIQIGIPYTPHSFSLQATNTNTATLQGASRGADEIRWGFEFTVPFTPARYFGGGDPGRPVVEPVPMTPLRGDTVHADMQSLAFRPASLEIARGTTVVWTNRDQVAHTVTAADGSWTSPSIGPNQSWARTFTDAGTYDIVCTPHPFMRARVTVTGGRP